MSNTPAQPEAPRSSTSTRVFIGLGLGLLVGVTFGEKVAFLRVGGDIFVAMLQITVIPYVMVALITSLGRLDIQQAKLLALKAGALLLTLWTLGLIVVLSSPMAFPDWPAASFFSTSQIEDRTGIDFLRLFIPSNIFASLSNAIVPSVVVFSILFGVALIGIPGKQRVVDVLTTVGDTLMVITGFIGRFAPYGVFAIIASAAGTIDITELARLQVYIVVYIALAIVLSFWIIPALVASLTPLRHRDVTGAFRGPLITAFATGSILIVLPMLAADAKRLLSEVEQDDDCTDKKENSVIDILISAAFPFPNLGVLFSLIFVLFGGWLVGSAISSADYPTLVGAGVPGLFGGTKLTLPILLDLFRLPADLFQLFITADVITGRFGTLLAGMHIIAIALIGTYAMLGQIIFHPWRLLRFAAVSLLLVAATLGGIRAFYTYVIVVPFTMDKVLTGLSLLGATQPHTVYRDIAEVPPAVEAPSSLARIQQTGTLRVCYRRSNYPSSFFNTNGDLVGFDIEMAHRFARRLDANIAFVPVDSIPDAERRIQDDYCDVFMSLMPITPEMTLRFGMTSPVLESAIGLVVDDYRRREFQTWDAVRALGPIRIAAPDNHTTGQFLRSRLPLAQPITFGDNTDIDALLNTEPRPFDALLMPAEEGAAWTIRHPRLSLVTPSPILLTPFAYSVKLGDAEMLAFLDAWLLNARGNRTIDTLYRFWMLGEVGETQPPRWSIARNVLGWFSD